MNRKGGPNSVSADLHSEEVTRDFFKSQVGKYEIFHYAGHFEYVRDDLSQSGLMLADGKLEVGLLVGLARDFPLPSLVFTNACQSGLTEKWSTGERLFGLANALFTAGVRHYIGGTRDLFDRMSASFAEEFYRQLLTNHSVGEALRQARIKSIRRYGEENLTWASYVLYGDPAFRYFEVGTPLMKEAPAYRARTYKGVLAAVAALVLIAAGGFLIGHLSNGRTARERLVREGFNLIHIGQLAKAEDAFSALAGKSPVYLQGMSAVYLNRGNLEKAEQNLALAQQEQAGAPYLGVLRATLALSQGQLNEAESGYRTALETKGLEGWQQAECYYGLGRIFLARGELPPAVEEFDQALKLDPSYLPAYTAKGLALERLGKSRDALDLYQKASGINPGDPINMVLYRKCQEQAEYRESTERRTRVDRLISDLLTSYREGTSRGDAGDEWSSRPLYLFFLTLEAKGQSAPREGEDAYISELISRELGNSTRIRAVERDLLDRLLERAQAR